MPTTTRTRWARVSVVGGGGGVVDHRDILAHRASRATPVGCAPCVNNPSNRPRRSSDSASATPSAAGCGSPATATSPGPSSGPSSGPGSRWRTPPASTRTRGSPTPAPRRPVPPARRSTSRSAWPRYRSRRGPRRARRVAARRARRAGGRGVARRVALGPARGQRVAYDGPVDRPRSRGRRAVAAFLAAEEVLVERMTKKGLRTFDCRAAVVSLHVRGATGNRGGVCDTRHGLATRNPVRETRRRPRRTPLSGGARGRVRSFARAARPGPPGGAARHGGRSVGTQPRHGVRRW